jgi:23S rRNA (guanosine2251-2'-O)-methyltransferase
MNATVHKRSAGAAAKTPVLSVTNLARSLRQLKEAGYWVIGTALSEQAKALDRVSLFGDLVLVMGSEGDGMRVNVQKQCDETVLIPMPDPSFTLNVSVATGICLYEIERQRRQDK